MSTVIGDYRLVKCDSRNWAIEQYRQIYYKDKETGEKKLAGEQWVECGCYGHNLSMLAKMAIFKAIPNGEACAHLIEKAAARIERLTLDALKKEGA